MKVVATLIFVVGLLSVVESSNCSTPILANLSVVENFNLTRFLGIWHEIEWLPAEPHSEADIWRDFYQSFQFENGSTTRLSVLGKARILNQDECFTFGPWTIIANNSAKMILERKSPNETTFINWPYHIVKTDYDNYALIYGCTSSNYSQTERCSKPILWLFSRSVTLATNHRTMLDNFIDETLCVNRTELEITPHSDKSCLHSFSLSQWNFSFNIFILTFVVEFYFRVK